MDLRELQKAYLDNLCQVTEEKLEIGSLIRTIISVDEGLVFKDGRKQKPKKHAKERKDLENEIALLRSDLYSGTKSLQ